MKRREFIKAAGVGTTALALPNITRARTPSIRPNIILIMADDLGYGNLGCYGSQKNETPHLNALAREGVRFTDFHTSGTVCTPTRAGLLTGRYQQRIGLIKAIFAEHDEPGLSPEEITFPRLLINAGYATGIIGKWHLGQVDKYNPIHHGFDRFRGYLHGNIDYISHYARIGGHDWWDGLRNIPEEGYVTHLITKHSIDFIERHREKPFFLFISHLAVHWPLQAPDDPPVRGPKKSKIKRSDRETYGIMLEEMDKSVGKIIKALKASGIEKNTLIFFLSDNGAEPPGSNAPLRGRKNQMWEGGHRVPAIAHWPGWIMHGVVTGELASSLDLMPTILELTEAKLPSHHTLDGISLVPLLKENKSIGNRKLFWDNAMREGRWKLIQEKNNISLYDLDSDIGERINLAAKHPERVRIMRTDLMKWKKDVYL